MMHRSEKRCDLVKMWFADVRSERLEAGPMTVHLNEKTLFQVAILRDYLKRSKDIETKGKMAKWLRDKGFRRDQAQALAAGKDIPLSRTERRLLSQLATMAGVPAIIEQVEERLEAIHASLDVLDEFELGVIAHDALHAWIPTALDTNNKRDHRIYFALIATTAIVTLRKKRTTLEQLRRGKLHRDVRAMLDADATRDRLQATLSFILNLIDSWRHQTPVADEAATKALRVLRLSILSDSLALESQVEGDDVALSKRYVAAGMVEEALFASDLLGHSRVSILHNAFRLAQMAGDYDLTTKVVEVYFGDSVAGYARDIAEIRTPLQGGIIDDESEWPGLAVLLLRADPSKVVEAHRILTRTSGPQYDRFRAFVDQARELINQDAPYRAVMDVVAKGE